MCLRGHSVEAVWMKIKTLEGLEGRRFFHVFFCWPWSSIRFFLAKFFYRWVFLFQIKTLFKKKTKTSICYEEFFILSDISSRNSQVIRAVISRSWPSCGAKKMDQWEMWDETPNDAWNTFLAGGFLPPIWKICVSQIGFIFPKVRDENKQYLKPPPSFSLEHMGKSVWKWQSGPWNGPVLVFRYMFPMQGVADKTCSMLRVVSILRMQVVQDWCVQVMPLTQGSLYYESKKYAPNKVEIPPNYHRFAASLIWQVLNPHPVAHLLVI